MLKKLMWLVVLPGLTIVLVVFLRVSFSVKEIIALSLLQFLWFLIAYLLGWEPRGLTFRRSLLLATMSIGFGAAMLLISSWAASR